MLTIQKKQKVNLCPHNASDDNRPTPSPRLRKHIKMENSNSESLKHNKNGCTSEITGEERKEGKDCRVSISCFNNLIDDLCLHRTDVEQKTTRIGEEIAVENSDKISKLQLYTDKVE